MLGRAQEQRRLHELLERARAGSGGALIVTGEPGVGKSILLSFALETAREQGFTTLSTSGSEFESELPFAGLQQLLAPMTERIDELAAPRAAALRGALGLADANTDDRLAIYLAASDLVSAAALEAPVLVSVDDLHWLDGASRDAILFLARRATGAAIAVLAGVRSELVEAWERSPVEQLVVPGLDEAAGVTLAYDTRSHLAPAVARELWMATRGNPLALVEIAPLLSDEQARGHAPLPQPLPTGSRLQQVFTRQLAQMPDPSRRMLLLAAASHTGRADVVRAAGRALEIDADALDPAESARLIAIREGVVAWRHPLLRAAIYHGAEGPERRAAHRALAQAGGEERLDDHRAWHLAAAAVEPDESIAEALEQLGERAGARGALSTTVRALHQAASLTPDDEPRSRRLLAAAEAATALGSWNEATAMIAEAEARSDSPLLRAQATRVLARVELLKGLPEASHARLVRAAESVKDLNPALAATMTAEAVVAHMASGRWDAYRDTATRALELGRAVGGVIEAVAGLALGSLHLAAGETATGLELFERYENVVWEPALWYQAPEIIGMYAFCQIWIERFDAADRLLSELLRSARRSGAVRAIPYPLAVQANLNFRRGRWHDALGEATEAVALSRELLDGAVLANNLGFLVQIEAALGRLDAAREHGAESLRLCETLSLGAVAPHTLQGLAILDLGEADYESALGRLERIGSDVAAGENEPGLSMWRAYAVEAYARVGNAEAARALLGDLDHFADATGRAIGRAHAARCHGLLAPDDEIEGHFEAALRWHGKAELPFPRAWTQLCYGERLRRAQRRAAARTQLAAAADTFRTLGAASWLRRAEAELAAAGARRRAPHGPTGWEELTQQERRVAELIIDGATYREAAQELFLSTRTIESHLRQIYRKLGVRSRTELTRRLASGHTGDAVDAPPAS